MPFLLPKAEEDDDGEEKGATGPSLYNNREAVNKEACPFGRD